MANDKSYDDINDILRLLYEDSFKYAQTYGLEAYRTRRDSAWQTQEIRKWFVLLYAKMMSKNIFVPTDTADKKFEYSPFHTLAMYFIDNGYDGIIYASTVCPECKNIVLFDKTYAVPCGKVRDYIIS